MHVNFFKYLRKLNKFSIVGKPRPNWIFHGKIFWKKEELKLKKMIINFCAFSVKSCKLRILITKALILSVRWPWGVTFPSASFYLPSAFFYFSSAFISFSFTVFYFLSPFFYFPLPVFQFPSLVLYFPSPVFYFPSPFFTSLQQIFQLPLTVFCTSFRHYFPFSVFTSLQYFYTFLKYPWKKQ